MGGEPGGGGGAPVTDENDRRIGAEIDKLPAQMEGKPWEKESQPP